MFVQKLPMLSLNSSLAELPSHDFKVSLTTLGEVVAQEFKQHPELPGVMITANDQLMGMISRNQFFEWLSRPYGVDTFLRRPIQSMWRMITDTKGVLDKQPIVEPYLILNVDCSIDKAVELALKRPAPIAYDPIVILGEDGEMRLLDMRVLLLTQSTLFALAKEAADTANRAKSEFLANMSHEVRTPLNAILGFAQVMSRDCSLSPEQQEHIGIINRSGEHLLELINDILQMSKIEAGKVSFNPNSFDLYRLLDDLKAMLQLRASSKGLQLIFEYTSDIPQYVNTDEGKLREILINLLGNAIKFTPQGSVILRIQNQSLSINRQEQESSLLPSFNSHLFFEVEDTGLGIAPEELNQLFTAFEQAEAGRESRQGTGLGLAISQKFVQLMGGNITVISTLGKGTTFSFDLRVTLAQKNEIQSPQETREVIGLAPNQPNYHILVVEDHPESRLLLVKLLTSLGFCVQEAENGQDAFELWSRNSPHLILMDMRMPGMDGYEATKLIRSVETFRQKISGGQATIIIALTASAFEEDRSRVLSVGCDDFIGKPFREQVLLEKIAQHLGVCYLYEDHVEIADNQYLYQSYQEAQDKLITSDRQDFDSTHSLNSHLSQMPRDWLEKLNQSALKCLDHEIIQLCEQIPENHALLNQTLRQWANNFLFDRILGLIQQSQVRV